MAEKLKVLIIEDEQRMRDLLVEVLPTMGYEPIPARTAEHGLRLMEGQPIDMVMLDLNLPVMGGMNFLEKLRDKGRNIPVIILTGFGSLDDARKAIRYEVVDFLSKPAHLGEIEASLDRARRRLTAQGGGASATDEPANLADIERKTILETLKRHDGNRTATAEELGISRRTLYNKLTEYEQKGLLDGP